jgi:hypothetical protein
VDSTNQQTSETGYNLRIHHNQQEQVEKDLGVLKNNVSKILNRLKSYENLPRIMEKVQSMLSGQGTNELPGRTCRAMGLKDAITQIRFFLLCDFVVGAGQHNEAHGRRQQSIEDYRPRMRDHAG